MFTKLSELDYLTEEQQQILSEFLSAFCSDVLQKKTMINYLKKHGVITNYDTAIPLSWSKEKQAELTPGQYEDVRFYTIWNYTDKKIFGEPADLRILALNFLRSVIVLGI